MKAHDFRDFDAFVDSVGDVDATMMMQNPVRHRWTIERVELGSIHIQRGRLGSGNIVEGQSWLDGYGLYLPLSDVCEYFFNGESVDTESFMTFYPGSEFCISTPDAHDWCSIFVPASELATGLSDANTAPKAARGRCQPRRPHPRVAKQFAALVQNVMRTATATTQFESSPAVAHAADTALRLVKRVIEDPPPREPLQAGRGRPSYSRQEIIDRCLELLEEDCSKHVRVCDLVSASGVSQRTLDTVFREYFGTSPRRYLQLKRLSAIRQTLRTAEADAVKVTDVLVQHGEYEIGRFARRYRELYGELPSETLKARLGIGKIRR